MYSRTAAGETLTDRKERSVDLAVSIRNGMVLPATVVAGSLAPSLATDLDDASTLGGHLCSLWLGRMEMRAAEWISLLMGASRDS